jgi:hypothetical protein
MNFYHAEELGFHGASRGKTEMRVLSAETIFIDYSPTFPCTLLSRKAVLENFCMVLDLVSTHGARS